jgi:hypothetical protein
LGGAATVVGRRGSRTAGGIERAGIVTVTRTGATWRVGSGDGIGTRRTGAATACTWVDLAGVDARARTTGVLVREGFAFARLFAFTAVFLAEVERALPLVFRCDAEAFNCFPLIWMVAPAIFGLPRHARSGLSSPTDCSKAASVVQSFFRRRIQHAGFATSPCSNWLVYKHLT